MEFQKVQEIEKKKRLLKRYRNSLSCLKRLEEKLLTLDEKMKTVRSPSYSGMPRGGTPVTIADLVSEKTELEERIERLKKKSKSLKSEILDEIDTLEDTRYIEVLEAYFIDGLSFNEIGDIMGYTERHIYNLYREAIDLLTLNDCSLSYQ